MGAKLFRRYCGGVELTEAGRKFLERARQGADEIRLALAAGDGETTGREISIGIFGPLTMGFLAELFGNFRRANPDTALRFREGGCEDIVAAVRRCELDLGVVIEASVGRGYCMTHLWDEPVYLAMADSDPLAARTSVQWSDLADRHFVVTGMPTGDFALAFLEKNLGTGHSGQHVEQLPVTRESLMQIVAQGGGLTIAGSAHARSALPGVTFRVVEDAILRYTAVHSSGSFNRDVSRLLSLARRLSGRDQEWFDRSSLLRPDHDRLPSGETAR